uniref:extensin-like n=1 Tax=Oncorhynchus gorbuscha TaxID=8017 RepID=UPI001EAEF5F0|nr:extensin-like [Oncorhynchus gorbuscha]
MWDNQNVAKKKTQEMPAINKAYDRANPTSPPAGSQPHVPLLPVPNPTPPPAGSQPHVPLLPVPNPTSPSCRFPTPRPSCRFPTPRPLLPVPNPTSLLPVPNPTSSCRFPTPRPLLPVPNPIPLLPVPNPTSTCRYPTPSPPAGSKPQVPLLVPLPVPNHTPSPPAGTTPRPLPVPNPTLSPCRPPAGSNPKSTCQFQTPSPPASSKPQVPPDTPCRYLTTPQVHLPLPHPKCPAGTQPKSLLPVANQVHCRYPTSPLCRTPPQVPLPVANPTSSCRYPNPAGYPTHSPAGTPTPPLRYQKIYRREIFTPPQPPTSTMAEPGQQDTEKPRRR